MIYAIEAVTCDGSHEGGEHKLGFIKFGRANNPAARLKELATGSPHRLFLVASEYWPDEIEGIIHRAFADYRVNGEWFSPSGRVEEFLITMCCPEGGGDAKFTACMSVLFDVFLEKGGQAPKGDCHG